MEYKRNLHIFNILAQKSLFLFGPRSVGKSTLIRQQLPNALVIDLLDRKTYSDLLRNSDYLSQLNVKPKQCVVIDEIQKLPSLLDEVHRLIEQKRWRFLLTGSSARKLKRGGANLLGGRAWHSELFPLNYSEVFDFDLMRFLNTGGLPYIYLSSNPNEELKEYVSLYLQEEVVAEALVRKVESFVSFLDVMALSNGQEINFQNLASDSGVPPRTIENYISILEDTLVGYQLKPFLKTKKRKAITRSKFYFFDIGVVNSLAHRGEILPKSQLFGVAFEHFIINELRAFHSYFRTGHPLHYWRSTSQFEVDCVIGDQMAIEIKGTELVTENHLKGLRALKEEKMLKHYVVISCDRRIRKTEDGITIYPWKEFLNRLWQGEFFTN